jgi:hypothetical protein
MATLKHEVWIGGDGQPGCCLADLPSRWRSLIERRVLERSGGRFKNLGAADFPPGQAVDIRFPDGSMATFMSAFFVVNEEHQELGVFTEHCGHHIFPLADLQYAVRVGGDREGR